MAAISLTTFSNAFSWMEIFVFQFRFHWSLFRAANLWKLTSVTKLQWFQYFCIILHKFQYFCAETTKKLRQISVFWSKFYENFSNKSAISVSKYWNSVTLGSPVCCLECYWKEPSIGLDNGLAPNRHQAIIWTNADPIHWRIYAALGGDELTRYTCLIYQGWDMQ